MNEVTPKQESSVNNTPEDPVLKKTLVSQMYGDFLLPLEASFFWISN
jgi:hypothetical protein